MSRTRSPGTGWRCLSEVSDRSGNPSEHLSGLIPGPASSPLITSRRYGSSECEIVPRRTGVTEMVVSVPTLLKVDVLSSKTRTEPLL